MEKNFCRVRSMSDIIITILLFLFGIGFIILPGFEGVNIAGYFLIVAGFIMAFVLKTAYKDTATGEIYSKKERYFAHTQQERLQQTLTCPGSFTSSGENEGSGLRLDVYYNSDRIIIQLLEYVPYSYEPCSNFYEHDVKNGSNFLRR